MTLAAAITAVRSGQAQRICTPGKWRVWRDGEKVLHEILSIRE